MTLADFRELSAAILRQALAPDAIDRERLAAVVHYVIANAAPGQLGHVKLNRILWHADLEHYRWHATTLTGLRYYARTQQGPMSQDISRAVGGLVREGKVAERTVPVTDYTRREMVSLEPPDTSLLTAAQIGILERMIKLIAPLTARQLSRMTRDDPLWSELENKEVMAVATGSIVTPAPAPQ
ncbi:MAG TPA: Panacea domain-containing protein [Xanthobacteraceae bacterium]|nr:Panacea domain-containing protein [Xanthobacteraceae bacterium]